MMLLFKIKRKLRRLFSSTLNPIREGKANPTKKGKRGEITVSYILESLPEHYQVINNLIIQNKERTSQIDHIVVSPFGLFVIETKNYSGLISGAERSENWKESFKTTGSHFFLKSNQTELGTYLRFIRVFEL